MGGLVFGTTIPGVGVLAVDCVVEVGGAVVEGGAGEAHPTSKDVTAANKNNFMPMFFSIPSIRCPYRGSNPP